MFFSYPLGKLDKLLTRTPETERPQIRTRIFCLYRDLVLVLLLYNVLIQILAITTADLEDPAEMEFSMLKKPLHFYKDRSQAPKWLSEANEKILTADALLLISCEYNHCIPPALSNMVDHFPGSSFAWKPSGLITYSPGIYGGMRAAMQLRALTGELGCISVSNIFGIPEVHKAIDENGTALNSHMDSGLEKLMKQLDWTATAFKNMRSTNGVPS
ncbi:hypothetical protein MAR_030497 [Mya arenaria]|uniref:NADPH-dependent FMN reductase-like domain-containing protein n=1 Tax=Mya arenaria TaxID=6604 RepID=A0ABY7F140_MYAAR|nr:hypothetical protein MAR_030497 [Mya arenaria]